MEKSDNEKLSRISLLLSIGAAVFDLFLISAQGVPLGIPFGIMAIGFALAYRKENKKLNKKAKAAVIISAIAIIIGIIIYIAVYISVNALQDPETARMIISLMEEYINQLPEDMQGLFQQLMPK